MAKAVPRCLGNVQCQKFKKKIDVKPQQSGQSPTRAQIAFAPFVREASLNAAGQCRDLKRRRSSHL